MAQDKGSDVTGFFAGLTRHIAQAVAKTRHVMGRGRSGCNELNSAADYESAFRDLFLSVEDGDPIYLHKRRKDDGHPLTK